MNKTTKKTRKFLRKQFTTAINNNNFWRALIIQALLIKSKKQDFTVDESRRIIN